MRIVSNYYKFLTIALLGSFATSAKAASSPPSSFFLCIECEEGFAPPGFSFFENYRSFQRANRNHALALGNRPHREAEIKLAKESDLPLFGSGASRHVLDPVFTGREDNVSVKEAAKRKILEALNSLDHAAPITLYLSGHGWNGSTTGIGTLPPEESGLIVKTRLDAFEDETDAILSNREIGELLERAELTGPRARPVRIVAEYCYGGGIHSLARKYPNVCSAAFTDNANPNLMSDDETGAMWRYVADETRTGRSPSLLEGFYAGWSVKNREDSIGGALSSTQYAKDLMKEKGRAQDELVHRTSLDWSSWANYSILGEGLRVKGLVRNESEKEPVQTGEFYALPSVTTDTTFADAKIALDAIVGDGSISALVLYREALEDLRANEGTYRALVLADQARLRALRARGTKLRFDEDDLRGHAGAGPLAGVIRWLNGASAKPAELHAERTALAREFANFVRERATKRQRYFRTKEYVERFAEFREFAEFYRDGKISENEMADYRRMLACESTPL